MTKPLHIIKAARCFRLDYPRHVGPNELEEALELRACREPGSQEFETIGFAANPITGRFLDRMEAPEAAHLTVEIRRRQLPAAVVNREVERRVRDIERTGERKVHRHERKDIQEQVTVELLPKAFVKSTLIHVFLNWHKDLVLVATGSEKDATAAMLLLGYAVPHTDDPEEAMGASWHPIRATVSPEKVMRRGLIATLRDGEPFAADDSGALLFQCAGYVKLTKNGQSSVFNVDDLEQSAEGIIELLENRFEVNTIGLEGVSPGVVGRVSGDLAIRSIEFSETEPEDDEPEDDEPDNEADRWLHEAETQFLLVSAFFDDLVTVFGAAEEAQPETVDGPEDDLI